MLHNRSLLFTTALALTAQPSTACDCEAYRLAVSMSLSPNTTLPKLPGVGGTTRVDSDPSGDTSAKYQGCGALLVTGRAPSLACGMRWGFGVYERLPQCSSTGTRPCGDWGGHPVYRHAWKGNYLWGDFEGNWFLGTAVGNYNAIYGYAEKLAGATRAEQIDPAVAKWVAFDVDRWVPSDVRLRCVPPHGKVAVTAPAPPAAELLDATAAAAADGDAAAGGFAGAPGCARLFLSGWSSAFSTGLAYSFGAYARVPSLLHGGRAVYRHSTGRPVFLYAEPASGRWVLGDAVGSASAHAFVDSNATTPLRVARDPVVVRRRWVGVVPSLGTWSAAGVTVDCLTPSPPPLPPATTTTGAPTLVVPGTESEPVVLQVQGGSKGGGVGGAGGRGKSSVQVVGQLRAADAQALMFAPHASASLNATLAALNARLGVAARAAVRGAHHTLSLSAAPPTLSLASDRSASAAASLELRLTPGSSRVELMLRLPADTDATEAYALAEELGGDSGGGGTAAERLGWASVEGSHVMQALPPPSTQRTGSGADGASAASAAAFTAAPASSAFPKTDTLLTAHTASRDAAAPCAAAVRQFCSATKGEASVAACLRRHTPSLDRGCTTLIKQLGHTIAARDSVRRPSNRSEAERDESDFPAVPAAMGILAAGAVLTAVGKRLQLRLAMNAQRDAAVTTPPVEEQTEDAAPASASGAVALAQGAASDI